MDVTQPPAARKVVAVSLNISCAPSGGQHPMRFYTVDTFCRGISAKAKTECEDGTLSSFVSDKLSQVLTSAEWEEELKRYPLRPHLELSGYDGGGFVNVFAGTLAMQNMLREQMPTTVDAACHMKDGDGRDLFYWAAADCLNYLLHEKQISPSEMSCADQVVAVIVLHYQRVVLHPFRA